MPQLSLTMFCTLLVVLPCLVFTAIGDLPETVAIHFSNTGVADAWATRQEYLLFILLLLVLLPSLLVWLMAGLPRLTKGKGQIPNCEYWFAPSRRKRTDKFLTDHACWLGCLTVAVIYGMHILLLRANATTPPALATDRFIVMIVFYLSGLVWWMMRLLHHFQSPGARND